MARFVTVGVAQLGPIARSETRRSVVERLLALMRQARAMRADLIVYPELALTTFFPRWVLTDEREIDSFFETEMPGPETKPLFDEARALGIGFHLGYAELALEDGRRRRFNTSILVGKDGAIIGKYRKIHLPGSAEALAGRKGQHLEKHYFEVGDLGFRVWRAFGGLFGLCICNDRRWPETYRVMGLQGVELVVLGYNTPSRNAREEAQALQKPLFHNRLSVQAGAYQNSTFVAAVAKAGSEDGHHMIGGSLIVDPQGEILAEAATEEDELIVQSLDLDATLYGKSTIFDFARHRRIEHYGLIATRTGAVPPPE